jgi:hypothetical protein
LRTGSDPYPLSSQNSVAVEAQKKTLKMIPQRVCRPLVACITFPRGGDKGDEEKMATKVATKVGGAESGSGLK